MRVSSFRLSHPLVLFSAFVFPWACSADPIAVTVPGAPKDGHIVQPNFFGLSIELSFIDLYFGDDTSSIPTTMLNYLSLLRQRTGSEPFRIRIGGNSAESSTYVETQTSPMVSLTNPDADFDNQPVNYGPVLWDVMQQVAEKSGGAIYLIGLPLQDPNHKNAVIAGAAKKVLGSNLDGILLGNEPDLVSVHNERPKLGHNYTTQDYFGEFGSVVNDLKNTQAGDLVAQPSVGGPTICCFWDLKTLITDGFFQHFGSALKYVTLQHYPQNNCFGTHAFGVSWYLQHKNTVNLAAWEKPGMELVLASGAETKAQLVMTEFNSAACGGVPEVSDTFGVGSLWTADYVLQQATLGFSATYIHTRERGIVYNAMEPPASAGGAWVTNPTYYPLIATAEILHTAGTKGANVVDLNIGNSMTDAKSPVAGYAVYDGESSSLSRVVIFNFGTAAAQFTIPASTVPKDSGKITVKYLSSSSTSEKFNIAWGGETFLGVGDGKPVPAPKDAAWAIPNADLDCAGGSNKDCTVNVQGPSMAVVFFTPPSTTAKPSSNSASNSTTTGPKSSSSSKSDSNSQADPNNAATGLIATGVSLWMTLCSAMILVWMA